MTQTVMQIEKVIYTAKARTTGGREGGASRTSDGRLNVKLTTALKVLIVGSGLTLLVSCAQQAGINRTDRATAMAGNTHGAPLRETVTVAAETSIPNLPGKRLVSLVVDYAPGASSAPHRHARSAFIYAYVLSGEIRSQVDDEPARIYRAGEHWFEKPGAHHRMSANASGTKPARLLAVFIVDAAEKELVTPDPQ